ncbi:pol-related protein [Clonorchis sinensis]|uniref:Pol-related protein n=1 Tax=Clonorchis sinensis TaxID=79923 RepID=H2KRJ5_CLOSI|nr:pol-related protein [Clonorchis sinensis]
MDVQIHYGAHVRPLLECANQGVYSGRKKDVILIERIQRAATMIFARLKSMDHERRLAVFDLFPLEYRRLRGNRILTCALFEQDSTNRFFTVDPANTWRRNDELVDKTVDLIAGNGTVPVYVRTASHALVWGRTTFKNLSTYHFSKVNYGMCSSDDCSSLSINECVNVDPKVLPMANHQSARDWVLKMMFDIPLHGSRNITTVTARVVYPRDNKVLEGNDSNMPWSVCWEPTRTRWYLYSTAKSTTVSSGSTVDLRLDNEKLRQENRGNAD